MRFLLAFLILAPQQDSTEDTTGIKAFIQPPEVAKQVYGIDIRPVVDHQAGLVYYEKWVDSVYLGIDYVVPVGAYLASLERVLSAESFEERLATKAKEEEEGGVKGIIPDIKIQIGKERTDVTVSGQDRITLGSQASFYQERDMFLEEEGGNDFLSGIQLKQELDVSVEGVIARKTEVEINHNSEGTDLTDANQVRITYTGDEDEVIKKIEAGDVSLNLPSKQSLPAHQGLFGINAQAQLGPVDVYAVASREQTKSETQEFTGSAQLQEGEIFARDFVKRRYFYVFHPALRQAVNTQGVKNNILVYTDDKSMSSTSSEEATFWKGSAWPYPNDTLNDTLNREVVRERDFYLLSPNDYGLRRYREGLVIELKGRSLPANTVLAVACKNSAGETFGSIDTLPDSDSTVANLLLVWPKDPDSTSVCWQNMRRNHYRPGGNLGVSQLKLEVLKLSEGSRWEPRDSKSNRYSYLLGLTDNNNNVHELDPDEQRLGEIIFDTLYPFTDPALGADTVHSIYWKRDRNLDANDGGNYKIVYMYQSLVTSYQLSPFVEKNSVRVYLNGQELDSNSYEVDYTMGTVTLKVPIQKTDELKISYETKEILSLDRKSLLGLRAETELTEGVSMGGSFLFRNVGYSMEGRPTLDLEPFSRTVGELDLTVERDLEFLTKWVDRVPLVSTDAASDLNVSAYSAFSMPNPNTHQSGSVWIDDFESTRESRSVGIASTGATGKWYTTSLVVDQTGFPLDTLLYSRRRPTWKLREIDDVRRDIYGEQPSTTEQPQVGHTFKINWDPEDADHWTGIIGSTYGRLPMDITEAENLEIILKPGDAQGRIHFDFGSSMDEDQLRLNQDGEIAGLGNFDTEDADGDNEYSDDEDTGLDGVKGPDDEDIPGDDGNDNYNAETNPNGTEGNAQLDSEDLLRDGFDSVNDFYRFTFDPQDFDFREEYVEELGGEGWIKITVPLRRSQLFDTVGSPDKSAISMFRMWFEGMTDDMEIQIHTWDFVGNKWKDAVVFAADSTEVDTLTEQVYIGVIGTDDDAQGYTPPFQLGYTSTGEQEKDHSLRMIYENLGTDHGAKVSRWDYNSMDFREYKRLRLYVHNDANDPLFYLRFGTDSTSYYEVRGRISEGMVPPNATDSRWQEFTFDLEDLAKLKKDNYDLLRYDTIRPVVVSGENPNLRVRGVPTLSLIRYLELGILNQDGQAEASGEIWFNELRLEGTHREQGVKLSVDGRLALADLATVGASYSRDDGKFVDFTTSPGPRTSGQRQQAGFHTTLNLDKFGLDRLGFSIPVKAGYSFSRSLPRYSAEITDYVLAEEERQIRRERSDVKTLSFSASHSQSKSRLLKYTLDAIRGSANYRISASNSNAGLAKDTSFTQNYSLSYQVSPDLYFTLFEKEKVHYFPNSISLSADFDKLNSFSWYRPSVEPRIDPYGDTVATADWEPSSNINSALSLRGGASYSPLKYLPLSANYSETRALEDSVWLDDLWNSDFYQRNVSLSGRITQINLKSFGRPSISASSSFTEDRSENAHDQFAEFFSLDSTVDTTVRNLNNSGALKLGWEGFNLAGMVSNAVRRTEKRFNEAKQASLTPDTLGEQFPDSLPQEPDTIPPDTLEERFPDFLPPQQDSLPPDTSDSLIPDFPDTLFADSLQADSDSLSADTAEVKEKEVLTPEARRLKERLTMLKTLNSVTGVLMPMSVDASFSRSSGLGWYVGPFSWSDDWDYVAGLTQVVKSDEEDSLRTFTDPRLNRGWSQSYNAQTGVSLLGFVVNTSAAYKYDKKTSYTDRYTFNSSWTLPTVTLSYTKIGELLKKWVNSSQLRSSFSRTLSCSGEIYDSAFVELDSTVTPIDTMKFDTVAVVDTQQVTNQYNFSPLISWNTSWKEKISTDLSLNYSITENLNTYGGQNTQTQQITSGGKVTLGYTFNKPSGFKLGFLKHIKFKNDLTLSTTLDYTQNATYKTVGSAPDPQDTRKTTKTSGTLSAQYTFSDAFDGGANFTVARFTDFKREINNHTDVNLDVFVVFRF